uniref:EpsG n=1 Tax=Vibrio parahaemolyticus TaxID=670 RepID=A0A5P4S8C0_VIBPH|nr:EpsG [Vibrio parahaemolyticus]QOS20076.1 hypothetical protein VP200_00012 [Vibrio parahaemolyticus]
MLLSLLVVLISLMASTFGYDLYFHILSATSLDATETLNFSINLGFGELPRYLLLHYYMIAIGSVGLPPVLFIVVVHSIPVYYLLTNSRMNEPLYFLAVFSAVLIMTIYWSAASTVTLYFMSFLLNEKSRDRNITWFFALSIHFICLPYAFLYLLVRRTEMKKIFTIIFFVFFMSYLIYETPSSLCAFQSTSYYNLFNYENLYIRVSYKIKEIIILSCFTVVIYLLGDRIYKIKNNIDIRLISLITMNFLVLMIFLYSFYFQLNNEKSGLYSLFLNNATAYNVEISKYGWLGMGINSDICSIMINRM